MNAQGKKPGVSFWCEMAIAALLLYSLSFGPACWISSRTGIGKNVLPTIYRPLLAAMTVG